jgi:hypothetical protein
MVAEKGNFFSSVRRLRIDVLIAEVNKLLIDRFERNTLEVTA